MESAELPRLIWRELKPALRSMAENHIPLSDACELFAKAYVGAALEITHGNQVRAARVIATHRNTIARWRRHK